MAAVAIGKGGGVGTAAHANVCIDLVLGDKRQRFERGAYVGIVTKRLII